MPRWWWICWTGLFCEKSQWKHWISVRLKLSKFQLQFILRNRQISEFDLQCRCSEVYLSASDLFDGTQLQELKLMDAEGDKDPTLEIFVNLWGLWLRPCPCVGISIAHGSSADDIRRKCRENSRTFGRSADSCKSMQIRYPLCPSVLQDPLTSSCWRSLQRIVWDGRKRWKTPWNASLEENHQTKFRHLPKLQPTQLELPIWQS